MRLKIFVTLSTVLTALVATTTAHRPLKLVIQEGTPNDFCLPMPSEKGGPFLTKFENAKTLCTKKDLIKGAEVFPEHFIQMGSVEVKHGDGYVQVTGVFNRTAYDWSASENGTQIRPNLPRGLTCKEITNHVGNERRYNFGFIEPNRGHFCFRCCTTIKHCDVHNPLAKERHYKTCKGNLEGSYTVPHTPASKSISATLSSSTTATATKTTTTQTTTQTQHGGAAAMSHSMGLLASAMLFAAGLAL
ncbi:unnamed protein product [Mortierella alpina]